MIASIPFFNGEAASPGKNRMVKEKINPAIQELAKKEGLIFVDNFSVLENKKNLYDADGVHPNPEGEKALAHNWFFWITNTL